MTQHNGDRVQLCHWYPALGSFTVASLPHTRAWSLEPEPPLPNSPAGLCSSRPEAALAESIGVAQPAQEALVLDEAIAFLGRGKFRVLGFGFWGSKKATRFAHKAAAMSANIMSSSTSCSLRGWLPGHVSCLYLEFGPQNPEVGGTPTLNPKPHVGKNCFHPAPPPPRVKGWSKAAFLHQHTSQIGHGDVAILPGCTKQYNMCGKYVLNTRSSGFGRCTYETSFSQHSWEKAENGLRA